MSTSSFFYYHDKINVRPVFVFLLFLLAPIVSEIDAVTDITASLNPELTVFPKQSLKIVGIMTQPLPQKLKNYFHQKFPLQSSFEDLLVFFPTSYSKWIKQENVMLVPINFRAPREILENQLNRISGLLLPGGKNPILITENDSQSTLLSHVSHVTQHKSAFGNIATHAIKFLKKRQQQEKIKIPIFGTCLGFELLLVESGFPNPIFTEVDNFKHSNKIILANKNKDDISPSLFDGTKIEIFEKSVSFYFNHRWAMLKSTYENTSNPIFDDFEVLAYSTKDKGLEKLTFVAAIQHRKFPIYGVQFHPEKNEFENGLKLKNDKKTLEIMNSFSTLFHENLEFLASNQDLEFWQKCLKEETAFKANDYGGFEEVFVMTQKFEARIII